VFDVNGNQIAQRSSLWRPSPGRNHHFINEPALCIVLQLTGMLLTEFSHLQRIWKRHMTIGMTIAFALLLLHAAPDAFLQSGVVDGAEVIFAAAFDSARDSVRAHTVFL
jgi:hypothetical protein